MDDRLPPLEPDDALGQLRIIAQLGDSDRHGDPEIAHMAADDILCRALLHFGGAEIEELVTLFRSMEKWYA